MKNSHFLLICFVILYAISSCKKDPLKNAKLPSATQEGKNTVGFTINGEVWVPYYKCGFFDNPCREVSVRYGASAGAAPNSLSFVVVRQRGDKSSSLTISSSTIGTITTTGNKIDSIGVFYRPEDWAFGNGNSGMYGYSPSSGSKFVITKFDKTNQIISGEYELILPEQNGSGKTITLKDGRFDFQFNACKCSK